MSYTILVGDCRESMKMLAAESVHCAVTSPPYHGLRSYLAVEPLVWGGDQACAHAWGEAIPGAFDRSFEGKVEGTDGVFERRKGRLGGAPAADAGNRCRCGAWRGHWGLEPSFEEWLAHSVEVFRELRRVLRKDGTFWLNVGQSYSNRCYVRQSSHQSGFGHESNDLAKSWVDLSKEGRTRMGAGEGWKEKDLVMQGPLLAEALRQDGWYLRSHIVWSKANCLPEAIKDRPAMSYEHVFLLAKSPTYFYDDVAVRVPYAESTKPQRGTRYKGQNTKDREDGSQDASDTKRRVIEGMEARGGRNLRTVWEEDDVERRALVELLRRGIEKRSVDDIQGVIGALMLRDPVLSLFCKTPTDEPEEAWARAEEALDLLEQRRSAAGPTDVWWVNPQALPSAHTAAFPEKLVETCLKAGTSEKGACPVCGAPWSRISTKELCETRGKVGPGEFDRSDVRLEAGAGPLWNHTGGVYGCYDVTTVGWEPGCACRRPDGQPFAPSPCVVLDTCLGSGTVAVVAERLGRDSIGCELSPLYAAQAEARIRDPEWATKERRRLRAERAAKAKQEGGP